MTETHKVYLGAELEVRDKRRVGASPQHSGCPPPRLNMEDPGFLRAVDLTHFYCGTNRKVKRGMIHRFTARRNFPSVSLLQMRPSALASTASLRYQPC